MSAWDGLVSQSTSAPTISGRPAPEGMTWVPGLCPNQGHACNCPGYCKPKLVPIGYRGKHRSQS